VYDLQSTQYFDHFRLGQLRGHAGYAVRTRDEIGVWFTKGLDGDTAVMGSTPVQVEAIGQVNAYVRHAWPSGARTGLWLGYAGGHERLVWVLPDRPGLTGALAYGADLDVPLDARFSLTGAANFVTPTASGTVDAYLGLTVHLGGRLARRAFSPLATVANNPSFAVDLRR
jgi:hypothetical protein